MLVGAVAVEEEGRGAVEDQVTTVEQRDRHLLAVGSRRPEPMAFVLVGVVAVHRLAFHDGGLAPFNVVVELRERCDQ